MAKDTKIIECPICESKVSAKILASKEVHPSDENPFCIYFLECPECDRAMVGVSDYVQVGFDEFDFDQPSRVWPAPKRHLDACIPDIVRKSIEEAHSCFKVKAYSATVVMCGRSLEAICKTHGVKKFNLAQGLRTLRESAVIDERIFKWGEELRKSRNIGAHATDEDISREDAKDLLDFTEAICQYVYVLTQKYDRFTERNKAKNVKTTSD